ncbi:hypothetical protein EYF80_034946 [Liparis tanakae]|uniref:Uncharacterized protein n=1 Tax=Liparis tanakae TaxID=230148 RepID=A0A4Z2GMP2_9TELE|nr:hypothetical protein EYF80_034946 [Liparis tanakae]
MLGESIVSYIPRPREIHFTDVQHHFEICGPNASQIKVIATGRGLVIKTAMAPEIMATHASQNSSNR